jgi:hypothetical protein
MAAAPWIVSDELRELIEPLLPKQKRRFRYPGRKRLPDRQALQGIRQSGLPLAFALTGSNRNDVTQLIPLLDAVPAVGGLVGRPRRRPDCVIADRACDHDKYRRLFRQRGIDR